MALAVLGAWADTESLDLVFRRPPCGVDTDSSKSNVDTWKTVIALGPFVSKHCSAGQDTSNGVGNPPG